MRMCLRWFGEDFDSVPLNHIRQIPGVEGVVTTLYNKNPGDKWPRAEISSLKKKVEDSGLQVFGVESLNVPDEIKVGHSSRDHFIEGYIETLKNLSGEGIHLVCYNFMSVFDWTRSELAKVRPDDSTVMAYDQNIIDGVNPTDMFERMKDKSGGHRLAGWEPERLAELENLFKLFKDIDNNRLYENFKYFLSAIMPTCEKYGMKMAVHIDDPVWSVFGLPRTVKGLEDLERITRDVPSEYNGITLCSGSLSSNPDNDIPAIIRSLEGRIHFAHVRNTRHTAPGVFEESAHFSEDGSLDMYRIMEALYDIGFTGPVRPDHGRAIWGEKAMPGYGLYDRALGAQYLLGLIEGIRKQSC